MKGGKDERSGMVTTWSAHHSYKLYFLCFQLYHQKSIWMETTRKIIFQANLVCVEECAKGYQVQKLELCQEKIRKISSNFTLKFKFLQLVLMFQPFCIQVNFILDQYVLNRGDNWQYFRYKKKSQIWRSSLIACWGFVKSVVCID